MIVVDALSAVYVAAVSLVFYYYFAGKEGDLPQADQGGQEQAEEDPRHWSSYCQAQGEEGRQVDAPSNVITPITTKSTTKAWAMET